MSRHCDFLLIKARRTGLTTMARHYAVTMTQAAKALGVGRAQLFELLRVRRHFLAGNVPDIALRQAGYFRIETRGFVLPGTDRERHYQRVVVTTAGLSWLQELIRVERRKETAPVGAGNCRAAHAGRAQSHAAASAAAMEAADTNTFEKFLGATPAAKQ